MKSKLMLRQKARMSWTEPTFGNVKASLLPFVHTTSLAVAFSKSGQRPQVLPQQEKKRETVA